MSDNKLTGKRQRWKYGGSKNLWTRESLAINILDAHGKPLSTGKLFAEIKKIMSVNQIHLSRNNPDLVLLEPELWGLRNRDLKAVTAEIETLLIEKIKNYFDTKSPIINFIELLKISTSIGLDRVASPFQIINLLRRYQTTGHQQALKKFKKTGVSAGLGALVVRANRECDACLIIDGLYEGEIPDMASSQ